MTWADYVLLLPDDAQQIAARLSRADELIEQAFHEINEWVHSPPTTFEGHRRSDGKIRIVVRTVTGVPESVPVLMSEVLHHLRSALDNALWYALGDQVHAEWEYPPS